MKGHINIIDSGILHPRCAAVLSSILVPKAPCGPFLCWRLGTSMQPDFKVHVAHKQVCGRATRSAQANRAFDLLEVQRGGAAVLQLCAGKDKLEHQSDLCEISVQTYSYSCNIPL